jgi:hypothetical protein
MHDKTNANVTDEIASRQIVQNMQDAQSTNDDELFASVSAQEHDYIAVNDKCVSSGTKKSEKSKKRTVYAPQAERNSTPPAVISVILDEDEDVEWIWTHTADGKSVVTGYIITKRTDKPRQRREVSIMTVKGLGQGGVGGVREALEANSGLGKDGNHVF